MSLRQFPWLADEKAIQRWSIVYGMNSSTSVPGRPTALRVATEQRRLVSSHTDMTLRENELGTDYGLPHPQWDAIAERVEALTPDEREDVYLQVIEAWLARMREELGPDAAVWRVDDAMLLSTSSHDQGERLLKWSIAAVRRIKSIVGEHFTPEMRGPMVVLLFANEERYYDYLAHYYEEDGEFMASGGICISSGYCHTVVGPGSFGTRQMILAHELTHLVVAPLPLPVWLNEGLAQVMEHELLGITHFTLDHEMVARHRAVWTPSLVREFWTGASFNYPDERSELSYHLAEVLVRNILSDHRKSFIQFVTEADWSDAGDTASREHFGCGVDRFLSTFLGEGAWQPELPDALYE